MASSPPASPRPPAHPPEWQRADGSAAPEPTPIAVARPSVPRQRWGVRLTARVRQSPTFVLVAALLLTLAATAFVAVSGRARDQARFEGAVATTRDRIQTRFEEYRAVLDGTAALFTIADPLSAAEFAAYLGQLDIGQRYPGLRGVGYSRVVWRAADGPFDAAARARALRAMQADGSEATHLWPDVPGRDAVHAITFLQPLDAPNRVALGYDMHSDPVRRAAMDAARDAAVAVASGPVRLVQDTLAGTPQIGFLIYHPLYRGDVVPATVAGRRQALAGYVYAAFRTGDLFRGIFGSDPEPQVEFRVYDGGDTTGTLLADSRLLRDVPRAAHRRRPPLDVRHVDSLSVAGRRWTVAFEPRPGAIGSSDSTAAAIGAFGLLTSVVLFLVTTAEVRARERAEQSDALRARFFAAMSHELRTPVNAVLGYNDLLLAGVYGPLPPAQQEGIQRSQRAARHLLELVNDVLDLSKLEAGKLEIARERVRLDALLDDLLVTIGPLAAERGCTLTLARDDRVVYLDTDPRRLRQILLNLLSNATKFGAGKPVLVRCELVDEPWAARGRLTRRRPAVAGERAAGAPPAHGVGAVAISVVDQGPGIRPEDQARIFEEFVQLPGSTPGGTGLGLPISRRLATLLGGTLEVSSTPGVGSTFTVTVPLSADAPPT